MAKRLGCLLAVMVLCGVTASAQVAVTDLLPGTISFTDPMALGLNQATYTPDNPAALQWGTASLIGAGGLKSKIGSGQPGPSPQYMGNFAGARWIGQDAAAALDYHGVNDDKDAPRLDYTEGNGQLAFRVLSFLSFGVGVGKVSAEDDSALQEVTSQLAGVSLNLGDWFYVGYAGGKDELAVFPKVAGAPFNSLRVNRDVNLYGVAIRTSGTVRFYLEASGGNRKNFASPLLPAQDQGGVETSTGAVQLAVWNIVVGFADTTYRLKDQQDSDIERRTYDLGWVREHGIALTARLIELSERRFDPATGQKPEVTSRTVAAAASYLF
jgi:hypothetical protein